MPSAGSVRRAVYDGNLAPGAVGVEGTPGARPGNLSPTPAGDPSHAPAGGPSHAAAGGPSHAPAPDPSRAPAVEAAGLAVRYPTRRVPALDGVDLIVRPGERLLLAGPSGSGKSTLALALAGLIPRTVEAEIRGQVRLGSAPLEELLPGEVAERVAMVFQDPSSQLTMGRVDDEVAFGLENLGRPAETMPATVEAALAAVDLSDRAAWPVDRLSGGQQQRVALAGILAMDPGTLVLDEPAAHLDPRAGDGLYGRIAGLARRRERTVIVVEHALDRVVERDLVDRCVVLDGDGRVALDGPLREVLGTPAAARACAAIGVWLPAPVRLALLLDPPDQLPMTIEEAARWLAADPCAAALVREAAANQDRQANRAGPAPAAPVLHATEATVRYRSPAGEHLALARASLSIAPGELIAVVGANGSGKSTLLRAVTGILPLSSGSVTVAGTDLARSGPDPRLVGHVFQNPEAAIVGETVADEVAYGPRALGRGGATLERDLADVLDRFGLARLAAANPYTLSQGQKRRLSIAAATIVRPRVLVLDEPTFGQDARSAAALVGEIAAIRRDGTAVLIATHDVEVVAEVADRVVGMAQGRIVVETTPDRFLADDRTLEATAQVPPPLARILRRASELGAAVPAMLRWADLEAAGRAQAGLPPARLGGAPP